MDKEKQMVNNFEFIIILLLLNLKTWSKSRIWIAFDRDSYSRKIISFLRKLDSRYSIDLNSEMCLNFFCSSEIFFFYSL
jgi:hypothetical protein